MARLIPKISIDEISSNRAMRLSCVGREAAERLYRLPQLPWLRLGTERSRKSKTFLKEEIDFVVAYSPPMECSYWKLGQRDRVSARERAWARVLGNGNL